MMHEITLRYPHFTNPQNFIQLCDQLENNGNLTQDNSLSIKRYFNSFIFKLRSAIFVHEEIEEIIRTGVYLTPLTSTAGPRQVPAQPQQEFDEYFKLRLYQDNLFYTLIGALDFISLKINLIYSNPIADPKDCNFRSLNNIFQQSHVQGSIQTQMNNICQSPWYQNIIPFRNCSTHRYLPDFHVDLSVDAGIVTATYLLPDDPLVVPHQYTQNREIVVFCRDKVDSCVNAVNVRYGEIINETNANNQIPY